MYGHWTVCRLRMPFIRIHADLLFFPAWFLEMIHAAIPPEKGY